MVVSALHVCGATWHNRKRLASLTIFNTQVSTPTS
jgi:hypothetical protein